MKISLSIALFLLCCLPLSSQVAAPTPAAQAPATAPVTQTHTSALGFAYGIPADWEVVDAAPMLPVLRQQAAKDATSEGEKQGAACVDVALTARHGDPASVIVVVALPFDCFGQQFSDKDLAAFGAGVAEGLKKTFTITDPVYGAYALGTHSIWIERAAGTYIDHPEVKRTVETVCSVLKKGAVCWMAMAADEDGMRTFEHGAVTLDGDAPVALVPADAFQKKP
jgi:hypothetical protein